MRQMPLDHERTSEIPEDGGSNPPRSILSELREFIFIILIEINYNSRGDQEFILDNTN